MFSNEADELLVGRGKPKYEFADNGDGTKTRLEWGCTALFGPMALQQIEAAMQNALAAKDLSMLPYNIVVSIIEQNGYHLKKQQRVNEWTIKDITNHLVTEANELKDEERRGGSKMECLLELADVQAVIYHYMIRKEITINDLANAVCTKLNERFATGPDIVAAPTLAAVPDAPKEEDGDKR